MENKCPYLDRSCNQAEYSCLALLLPEKDSSNYSSMNLYLWSTQQDALHHLGRW